MRKSVGTEMLKQALKEQFAADEPDMATVDQLRRQRVDKYFQWRREVACYGGDVEVMLAAKFVVRRPVWVWVLVDELAARNCSTVHEKHAPDTSVGFAGKYVLVHRYPEVSGSMGCESSAVHLCYRGRGHSSGMYDLLLWNQR